MHADTDGQDPNGNTVRGNQIATNDVKGDQGTPSVGQTAGVVVRAAGSLAVTATGNTIADDHFGLWTAGPVTASGATGNTFKAAHVQVFTN
ncbi:hypothetical protein ACWDE9_18185 [Streptomyces olivaceoviridis]